MNRDDVIRMAREAGLKHGQHWDKSNMDTMHVERLIKIAQAAEREACARVCEERAISYGHETDFYAHEHVSEARYCAAAIRARGEGK